MKQEEKIQEMQFLEQTLQSILHQKQAFQLELDETKTALKEIDSSEGETFKIIGQIMIQSDKSKIKTELENKKNIIDIRLKNLEKQEKALTERFEKLREEILKSMKK